MITTISIISSATLICFMLVMQILIIYNNGEINNLSTDSSVNDTISTITTINAVGFILPTILTFLGLYLLKNNSI